MRWEYRERFPRHRLQRKPLVSDPDMHHGTCVTHVPWRILGSLTRGGGEMFPAFPAHAYLARGPWVMMYSVASFLIVVGAKPFPANQTAKYESVSIVLFPVLWFQATVSNKKKSRYTNVKYHCEISWYFSVPCLPQSLRNYKEEAKIKPSVKALAMPGQWITWPVKRTMMIYLFIFLLFIVFAFVVMILVIP